ncbi:MAG TPA: ABC transporter substrate-binding protein, partial [Dehalococcoidia bacterium]|nr:ABC transporter substrate-binding protein [Dehalococcoidia bacterium]
MTYSSYRQRLAERRVSRRRVLAAGGAAGLGVAGLALGACGGGAQDGASDIPTAPPVSTPKAGGKVKLGVAADPGSLDPHRNVASSFISSLIHNPLHTVDMSTEEFIPLVAEKLEQPDQLTYVWTLRKGVKFHDIDPTFGRELNADDVVYSFDRLKAGPTLNDRKLLTLRADGYEAVDSGTFRLRTKIPFSPTIDQAGSYAYSILPREAVEKWGGELATNASGCGAWILTDYSRSERISLRKNPDFYLSGKPYPDEEEWLIIPDLGTLWQTFKTGNIDYAAINVDKYKRQEIEGDESFYLVEAPSLWTTDCRIRVDGPPFSDARVREALDIAINRDDLIEKLYFGDGGYNGPIPWPLEYWALPQDELKAALKYDPEKARQLLSAAGYDNGLELSFPLPGMGDLPKTAQVIQEHYSRVGVTAKIEPKDLGTFLAQSLYGHQFDICIFTNQPFQEPDIILREYYSNGQNADVSPSLANDPEADALIEGLWSVFDQEERRTSV